MSAILAIDICIVCYRTSSEQLQRLLESIAAVTSGLSLHVGIWDNSVEADASASIHKVLTPFEHRFESMRLELSTANLGFGQANNALAARAKTDWLLLLNPDTALLPGALETLLAHAAQDAAGAAWEFRQRPYEHPKNYHPISLETGWVSGAAVLFRRSAFEQVGGFEPALFLYGEDVDLSWRLRAAGWKLRYLPWASVIHDSYRHAGEIKPQQLAGSTLANLLLRARYGNWRDVRSGYRMLWREIRTPESFPGRRQALINNLWKSLKRIPYFRRTRVKANDSFQPCFAAWDFELRRKGAFFTASEATSHPLVSILIRTHRRPQWLREALLSAERQTWPNVEIVVIEDGPDLAREMIESEFAHLAPRLKYHATGTPVGRARAGNLALHMASGEWFNFLDDDDLLYADHVESLLAVAQAENLPGVYGIAWETPTVIDSDEPLRYRETAWLLRFQMPFNHATLWVENFMPIQTVLFHRRLYEKHGGFAVDMDQLEDWNLWTRYTLEDRFALVDKTTSLYRVPAESGVAQQRQEALDLAYREARLRQLDMRTALPPAQIVDDVRLSHALNPVPTTAHLARCLAERFALGRLAVRVCMRLRRTA